MKHTGRAKFIKKKRSKKKEQKKTIRPSRKMNIKCRRENMCGLAGESFSDFRVFFLKKKHSFASSSKKTRPVLPSSVTRWRTFRRPDRPSPAAPAEEPPPPAMTTTTTPEALGSRRMRRMRRRRRRNRWADPGPVLPSTRAPSRAAAPSTSRC